MRPQLVIFDLDGTLVDSERIGMDNIRQATVELGAERSLDEVRSTVLGLSWEDTFHWLESISGREVKPSFREMIKRRERVRFIRELHPVPGVEAMLERITRAGLPVWVGSSEDPEAIVLKLRAAGLLRFFRNRLSSAVEVAHGKPAPDLFLLAASRAGVPPEGCVVVEDSPKGVVAAVAAGMRALSYVGDPHADREVHEAAGASALFADMSELPALLGV